LRGTEVGEACAMRRTNGCMILVIKLKEMEMLGRAGSRWEDNIVKPGYNDIGLCDTLTKASDIWWYQLFPLF